MYGSAYTTESGRIDFKFYIQNLEMIWNVTLPRVQFAFSSLFLTILCWFILKIIWYFRQEGKRLDSNFLITIIRLNIGMFMMRVLVVLVAMSSKCHVVTPHMGQQCSTDNSVYIIFLRSLPGPPSTCLFVEWLFSYATQGVASLMIILT